MMLCQQEEREEGRAYPRTCPTCKLGPCQKFGAKPLQSLSEAQAEIARLTAERDQALARAAAAAMDMREMAEQWAQRHYNSKMHQTYIKGTIRALPIDPDAQKALDKLLSQVRADAIREAAGVLTREFNISDISIDGVTLHGCNMAPPYACRYAILALLNDGEDDGKTT